MSSLQDLEGQLAGVRLEVQTLEGMVANDRAVIHRLESIVNELEIRLATLSVYVSGETHLYVPATTKHGSLGHDIIEMQTRVDYIDATNISNAITEMDTF